MEITINQLANVNGGSATENIKKYRIILLGLGVALGIIGIGISVGIIIALNKKKNNRKYSVL